MSFFVLKEMNNLKKNLISIIIFLIFLLNGCVVDQYADVGEEDYQTSSSLTYTITFVSNGGTDIESLSVLHGNSISEPVEPIKDGYVFCGWYSDDEFTSKYTFGSPVYGNTTLYANWDAKHSFTIKFESNGGSYVEDLIIDSDVIDIGLPTPIKEGFIFDDWYTDQSFSKRLQYGDTINHDLILYARWTYDIQYLNNITYQQNDDEIEITGCVNNCKNIAIPSTINGYVVTRIRDEAFKNTTIETFFVDYNSKLNYIGNHAFEGSLLTKIEIPNSITTIGTEILKDTSITDITLPGKIVIKDLFSEEIPTSLQNIIITNGSTLIGEYALANISSPVIITIPSSVTEFGKHAFSASHISRLILQPDSQLTTINNCAFQSTKELDSFVIPKTVTDIKPFAFRYSNIANILFESEAQITKIGVSVFEGAKKITSFKVPMSITKIENNAFTGCSNLSSLIFEENSQLTHIYDYAFSGTKLTSLYIPKMVKSISGHGLQRLSFLESLVIDEENNYYKTENGILFTKDGTKLVSYVYGEQEDYIIPNGVVTIGEFAFYNTAFKNIIIPNTVIIIETMAFSLTSELSKITIPNSVQNLTFATFSSSAIQSVNFESGSQIENIGPDTFSNCNNIQSIVIPKSVKTIGSHAFYNMDNLTSLIFETDSNLEEIGDYVFSHSRELSSIIFPENLSKIGEYVFSSTSIDSLTFLSTTPPLLTSHLLMNAPIYDQKIYVPEGSLYAYKNAPVWSLMVDKIYPINQ